VCFSMVLGMICVDVTFDWPAIRGAPDAWKAAQMYYSHVAHPDALVGKIFIPLIIVVLLVTLFSRAYKHKSLSDIVMAVVFVFGGAYFALIVKPAQEQLFDSMPENQVLERVRTIFLGHCILAFTSIVGIVIYHIRAPGKSKLHKLT